MNKPNSFKGKSELNKKIRITGFNGESASHYYSKKHEDRLRNDKSKINHEKLSFINELLTRTCVDSEGEIELSKQTFVAYTISKFREIYPYNGDVKINRTFSFFKNALMFSDDEKTDIVETLIYLINMDDNADYRQLSLTISYCIFLNLDVKDAENIISDAARRILSLDINEFYSYILKRFTTVKEEVEGFKLSLEEKNYDLINDILELDHEEIAEEFKFLPADLKNEIFMATIVFDGIESLAQNEADDFNIKAWDKMMSGDFDDALVDAKKSIETFPMSRNHDTIALIYFHSKNYQEALKHADISINLNEFKSDHYVTRTKIHLNMGEKVKALIDLKRAVEISKIEGPDKLLNEIDETNINDNSEEFKNESKWLMIIFLIVSFLIGFTIAYGIFNDRILTEEDLYEYEKPEWYE